MHHAGGGSSDNDDDADEENIDEGRRLTGVTRRPSRLPLQNIASANNVVGAPTAAMSAASSHGWAAAPSSRRFQQLQPMLSASAGYDDVQQMHVHAVGGSGESQRRRQQQQRPAVANSSQSAAASADVRSKSGSDVGGELAQDQCLEQDDGRFAHGVETPLYSLTVQS